MSRSKDEIYRDDEIAEKLGEASRAEELADPDLGRTLLDRRINQVVEVLGIVILATMVLLIFLNATGRYLVATPIVWAEELIIELIPWLAMCGMFLSIRRGSIIRIEFFLELAPEAVRSTLSMLAAFLSALAFVYLAYHSFHYVSLFGGDPTSYLELPTGWFSSAMVAGAIACALAFLWEMVSRSRPGPRA